MSSKINDLKNLQKNKNDTSNKISKSDDKKKEDSIKADSVKADSKKEVDKDFLVELCQLLHKASIRKQTEVMNAGGGI